MPRANRHFLPGHVWHLTHRCHQKAFLLKFARDRRCYLSWVFEAKKRFGLSVLNYMVTSNHIHLLVKDTGPNVIAQSMQLIAGRTAQEYNQRKGRQGAFWEDRYHATAIEANDHLHRCLGVCRRINHNFQKWAGEPKKLIFFIAESQSDPKNKAGVGKFSHGLSILSISPTDS